MKLFIRFISWILVMIYGPSVLAQTCEQIFENSISAWTNQCINTETENCNYWVRYETSRDSSPIPILNVRCFRTCPEYPDLEWSLNQIHFCEADANSSSRVENNTTQWPRYKCGSIVQVENQILGESVPIVGVDFSLNYFSNWSQGRSGDYTINVPLAGAVPRDTIDSFDVFVYLGGTTLQTLHHNNTQPNFNFRYLWNGLDVNGIPVLGSQKFNVKVIENHSSMQIPIQDEVVLGSFKAKLLGLGGWLPSNYVFYDSNAKKIYKGDGTVRAIEAAPYGVGQFFVSDINGKEVYIFDANGRHLSTKTGLLGTTILSFNYTTQGHLLSIVDAFGRVTSFDKDVLGKFKSITAPHGQISLVTLNGDGNLIEIKNPNNETYTFSYENPNGLLKTFQKPGGQISTFTYDSFGNILKDSHSGGYFFELVKNINNNIFDISSTSALGRATSYIANGDGTTINNTTTLPSGVQETYSYSESANNAVLSENSGGVYHSASGAPDARFPPGMVYYNFSTSVSTSAGTRSSMTSQSVVLNNPSDPFSISSLSFITNYNGANTSISTTYDPSTRIFSSVSYLGKSQQMKIDMFERVISSKQGNLNAVDYSYTNEKLTLISQGSRSTQLTYNTTSGFLESIVDPLNKITSLIYDNAGRVTSKILPDSRIIGYGYDANGNIISITPPGKPAHIFGFNAHELPGSYEPPVLTGVSIVNTTYAYNLDKQLTQILRPNGATIDFNYNATTGILENYVTPAGTYTLTIDSVTGLPLYISQPNGSSSSITYAGSTMTGSTSYDGSSSLIGSYAQTFSSIALVDSDTVSNPSGTNSTITYQYNDDEDLKKAGDVTLSYNTPNGQLTGTSIGSGSSAITDIYTYDNYGEITNYVAKRGTTTIYSLTLARDNSGRINGKTQIMNATTDAYDYTFDDTGRLTETKKNTATVATYTYDSNSNRNGGTIGAQPTTATYDDQDRLNTYNTLSFTYNANGDLTSKTNNTLSQTTQYTYDVFGNLTQVQLPGGTTITYEIDGLNRRIGKKVNGVLQRRWIYMDQYRIAAELNASGTITKRFVYGSKSNIPDYMIASGVKYRIISDHLGSPRLVVKMTDGTITQRMDHDEFGRVTTNTNPDFTPFGFAGGLYDQQTGLVRFGARDYDSEVGRWTLKDPILFKGMQTNLYGYSFVDPINFIDPSGNVGFAGAIVGGVAGAVTGGILAVSNNTNILSGILTGAATGAFIGATGSYFAYGAAVLEAGLVGQVVSGSAGLFVSGFTTSLLTDQLNGKKPSVGSATMSGAVCAAGGAGGQVMGSGLSTGSQIAIDGAMSLITMPVEIIYGTK